MNKIQNQIVGFKIYTFNKAFIKNFWNQAGMLDEEI
jgi:hypothetical protein